MKKKLSKFIIVIMAACMMHSMTLTVRAEEGYTYNYDYWGDIQYSPDAYDVVGVYTAADLKLDVNLKNPNGIYVHDRMIYICDTGNNRILEIERDDADGFSLKRIIDSFTGDAAVTIFATPMDVAVTDDGFIYIADKENHRVVKLDMDLNYIMEFTQPVDESYDASMSFLPEKIVVDDVGRVYCIAENVNKGLIRYEADGTFKGFIGASKVTYDWYDYIWKKFSTAAQRAAMNSFVPTEYDNIYMDSEGFIYACTSNVSEKNLDSGAAEPIRRLNMLGNNILVENGDSLVIGDLYWGEAGGYAGPSLFTDITALDENGIYFGLDRVRGRIFAWDDQGNLLYAFGGSGNMDGYFKNAAAIEHMGKDILVLDSTDNSLTVFTPTEFGALIYQAIEEYEAGQYDISGDTWRHVLALNGNYNLAYIGIGKSLLREGEYKQAMEYFSLKYDEDNYSKAFKLYRKQWVEEHIGWIFAGAFIIIILPLLIGRVRKTKHEIDIADIFRE